jgi:cytochrome c-type biogenesis protein CcmF
MWESLPEFGTGVLYAVLVCAAYTFAVSVASASKPRLLSSARLGAYGTCALVMLGVVLLAYAFITHDFRIRYVARYSDRSMTTPYLFTALWGGQDGSLLWWLFLLSGYVAACVRWLEGKYRLLQPYVIATLMVIVGFFAVLMLFSANPFATSIAGARVDGEGLNPLLRNYYMIIHPPSLYMGFVGCSIPFAFAVAALITGRLDSEWINAVRKWMLFAWMFLSVGNALGMKWAYEELGWGGYWAWDPVENAACLPWFTATAYVHSTMIQERRNTLKVWNVFLICATFFLTIFGTFLTRSGLISSVHSFAQSDIGTYFVWFMGFILASCAALINWRLPLLKPQGRIESLLSREAAFVVNNWALVGGCTFIAVATTWPLVTEFFQGQQAMVGPPFYNRWMTPIGLVILALMGAAPLFGWRKTSDVSLKRAFRLPTIVMLIVAVLHLAFGSAIGFPAYVLDPPTYTGAVGSVVQQLAAISPLITIALVSFNFAVVYQEFHRGVRARRKNATEGVFEALLTLVRKSRRRYGGYIVHVGIVLMCLGFAGQGFKQSNQVLLKPGQQTTLGSYTVRMDALKVTEDSQKQMVTGHFTVLEGGSEIAKMYPARWFFNKHEEPTTEVAIRRKFHEDLYLNMPTFQVADQTANLEIVINPLVNWIWFGFAVMALGTGIVLLPERTFAFAMAKFPAPEVASTAGTFLLILLLAAPAMAQHTETGGSVPVEVYSPAERELQRDIVCMCGTCGRKNLAECTCSKAAEMRTELSRLVKEGKTREEVIQYYVAQYGSQEPLAAPIDEGFNRLAWLFPYALGGVAAIGGAFVVRKWSRRSQDAPQAPRHATPSVEDVELQARLDRELESLD